MNKTSIRFPTIVFVKIEDRREFLQCVLIVGEKKRIGQFIIYLEIAIISLYVVRLIAINWHFSIVFSPISFGVFLIFFSGAKTVFINSAISRRRNCYLTALKQSIYAQLYISIIQAKCLLYNAKLVCH